MDTQYLTHHQLVQQSYSKQGLAGADPTYGHVAFVEAVNADGSLYISEMNVRGLNVISYHVQSQQALQLKQHTSVSNMNEMTVS